MDLNLDTGLGENLKSLPMFTLILPHTSCNIYPGTQAVNMYPEINANSHVSKKNQTRNQDDILGVGRKQFATIFISLAIIKNVQSKITYGVSDHISELHCSARIICVCVHNVARKKIIKVKM